MKTLMLSIVECIAAYSGPRGNIGLLQTAVEGIRCLA